MPFGDYNWPDPLPTINIDPDSAPTVTVTFNSEYVKVIIGALNSLQEPWNWEGTPADQELMIQRLSDLIAIFAESL